MATESLLLFVWESVVVFEPCQELQTSLTQITNTYLRDTEIVFFTNFDTLQTSHVFNCINSAIAKIDPFFTINVDINVGFMDIDVPKPRNIVLYIDGNDIDSFVKMCGRNPYWNARAKILVVSNNSKFVKDWIEFLWKRTWAVNLIVISLDEKFTYNTWFPYKAHECGEVKTIVSLNFSELYTPKIGKDMSGCPIKALCSYVLPFVANQQKGIESEIFIAISQALNLTRVFVNSSTEAYNYLNMKGEIAGAGKMLQNHEVEVMFANLLRGYLNSKYFDLVVSHTEDSLSWFVPSPKPVSRAIGLYFAFAPELWLAVAFVTFITLLVCLFFNYFTYNQNRPIDIFLQTWSLTLNLDSPSLISTSGRFLILAVYIYSLHITTAYQASLITFLSNIPREKPILTVEEAAENTNLKVYLLYAYLNVIVNISQHEVWNKLLLPGRPFYFFRLPINQLLAGDAIELAPKHTLSFSLQNKTYFDKFGHPVMSVLEKPNFSTAVNFFMSQGHPLYHQFNKLTSGLVEGGLPLHWARHFLDNRFKQQLNTTKQPFGVSNLEGAFMILLVMLALSFVTFSLEILYFWLNNKKQHAKVVRFRKKAKNLGSPSSL